MNYFALPKIDLHCHLDGSVRPQTIIDLSIEQNITLPTTNVDEVKALMVAPESCPDLEEYLSRFHLPVSVMQVASGLERIAFELFEDAAQENVKYLEVRFGPLLHLEKGLTLTEVFESVIKGMRKAESLYDIKGNFILSLLKHMPKDRINEVIDAGAPFLGKGIVAFDLAGSEPDGFSHEFVPHARYASEKGYRITIHAGEQGSGQNVHDSVSLLGAERVGHGIHITGHKEAYDLVKDQTIALETCPSSNIQTKAVSSLAEHPVEAFYKDGLQVTINTDNRTVSNTTMTDEVRKVCEAFNLTEADYFNIYKISVEQAFTTDEVKQHLMAFVK